MKNVVLPQVFHVGNVVFVVLCFIQFPLIIQLRTEWSGQGGNSQTTENSQSQHL